MGLASLKIISGGQTGADRAALDWAIARRIPHGGWCPLGRKAEDGIIEARYLLQETPSAHYVQRTEWNVRDSDATVIISLNPLLGGGAQKTLDFARKLKKPCLVLSRAASGKDAAARLYRFVQQNRVKLLNIAGPRASEEPAVETFVKELLDQWQELRGKVHKTAPRLVTSRLVLRPFGLADAATLPQLAGAREIADTTVSIPHPYSETQARQWIARTAELTEQGTELALAVTLQGNVIGAVGLRDINPEHSSAELGAWIAVPFWGRGYGTEAVRALVRFGFEDLQLNRICAHHMVRNPASGRMLSKAGMKPEGRLRQGVRKWGVFEDVVLLAILKEDWLRAASEDRSQKETCPAPD